MGHLLLDSHVCSSANASSICNSRGEFQRVHSLWCTTVIASSVLHPSTVDLKKKKPIGSRQDNGTRRVGPPPPVSIRSSGDDTAYWVHWGSDRQLWACRCHVPLPMAATCRLAELLMCHEP
eukprot:6208082-Pleurochrysis_carterae.AAC.1